jgi:hypothetical protein
MSIQSRPLVIVFGVLDLAVACLVILGVFWGLPARWWPIDVAAGVLVAFELASGTALLSGVAWGIALAAVAAGMALALGLVLLTGLAVTASWLSGVYGPVGRGGAILYVLIAALVTPYLVALPALQLWWALRQRDRA